jgi:hypothetical protein
MEQSGKAYPALAADAPGVEAIYWPNFKWLAEESRSWTLERVSAAGG